jgi:predicted outer membrane repeat protein
MYEGEAWTLESPFTGGASGPDAITTVELYIGSNDGNIPLQPVVNLTSDIKCVNDDPAVNSGSGTHRDRKQARCQHNGERAYVLQQHTGGANPSWEDSPEVVYVMSGNEEPDPDFHKKCQNLPDTEKSTYPWMGSNVPCMTNLILRLPKKKLFRIALRSYNAQFASKLSSEFVVETAGACPPEFKGLNCDQPVLCPSGTRSALCTKTTRTTVIVSGFTSETFDLNKYLDAQAKFLGVSREDLVSNAPPVFNEDGTVVVDFSVSSSKDQEDAVAKKVKSMSNPEQRPVKTTMVFPGTPGTFQTGDFIKAYAERISCRTCDPQVIVDPSDIEVQVYPKSTKGERTVELKISVMAQNAAASTILADQMVSAGKHEEHTIETAPSTISSKLELAHAGSVEDFNLEDFKEGYKNYLGLTEEQARSLVVTVKTSSSGKVELDISVMVTGNATSTSVLTKTTSLKLQSSIDTLFDEVNQAVNATAKAKGVSPVPIGVPTPTSVVPSGFTATKVTDMRSDAQILVDAFQTQMQASAQNNASEYYVEPGPDGKRSVPTIDFNLVSTPAGGAPTVAPTVGESLQTAMESAGVPSKKPVKSKLTMAGTAATFNTAAFIEGYATYLGIKDTNDISIVVRDKEGGGVELDIIVLTDSDEAADAMIAKAAELSSAETGPAMTPIESKLVLPISSAADFDEESFKTAYAKQLGLSGDDTSNIKVIVVEKDGKLELSISTLVPETNSAGVLNKIEALGGADGLEASALVAKINEEVDKKFETETAAAAADCTRRQELGEISQCPAPPTKKLLPVDAKLSVPEGGDPSLGATVPGKTPAAALVASVNSAIEDASNTTPIVSKLTLPIEDANDFDEESFKKGYAKQIGLDSRDTSNINVVVVEKDGKLELTITCEVPTSQADIVVANTAQLSESPAAANALVDKVNEEVRKRAASNGDTEPKIIDTSVNPISVPSDGAPAKSQAKVVTPTTIAEDSVAVPPDGAPGAPPPPTNMVAKEPERLSNPDDPSEHDIVVVMIGQTGTGGVNENGDPDPVGSITTAMEKLKEKAKVRSEITFKGLKAGNITLEQARKSLAQFCAVIPASRIQILNLEPDAEGDMMVRFQISTTNADKAALIAKIQTASSSSSNVAQMRTAITAQGGPGALLLTIPTVVATEVNTPVELVLVPSTEAVAVPFQACNMNFSKSTNLHGTSDKPFFIKKTIIECSANSSSSTSFSSSAMISVSNAGTVAKIDGITLKSTRPVAGGGGLLKVSSGGRAVVKDVIIDGGVALSGDGGAIAVLQNSVFDGSNLEIKNSVAQAGDGGALSCSGTGAVCSLSGRILFSGSVAAHGRGGAIAVKAGGVLTVSTNTAQLTGNSALEGGALSVSAGASLNVVGEMQISKNQARRGGGMFIQEGTVDGGVDADSRGILLDGNAATQNLTYVNELDKNPPPDTPDPLLRFQEVAGGRGGGAYVVRASVTGIKAVKNTAFLGAGFYFGGPSLGGSSTTVGSVVTNIEVKDNTAGQNGGGIFVADPGGLSLIGTSVVGNQAESSGGGIALVPSSHTGTTVLQIDGGCSFTLNTAVSGLGGAIFVSGAGSSGAQASVKVTLGGPTQAQIKIADNKAVMT